MRKLHIFLLFPIIYSTLFVFHLVPEYFNHILLGYLLPFLLATLSILLFVLSLRHKISIYYMLLLPCFFSMFYFTGHWYFGNAPFGIGLGGFFFFLHWLTKYPNFGPINYEIALGMICIFLNHFLPLLFIFIILIFKNRKSILLLIILILDLIAYLPVIIKLDYLNMAVLFGFPYQFPLFVFFSIFFRVTPILIMLIILIFNKRIFQNNTAPNSLFLSATPQGGRSALARAKSSSFLGWIWRAGGHWPGRIKITCSSAVVVLKSSVSAAPGQRQKKAGRWMKECVHYFYQPGFLP